jgi:putative NADPH-quinone reductase
MKVFIVHAHAEPKSFNGALFQTAQLVLRKAGHHVETSDLYGMKFDPISDRRNFTTIKNPEFFILNFTRQPRHDACQEKTIGRWTSFSPANPSQDEGKSATQTKHANALPASWRCPG